MDTITPVAQYIESHLQRISQSCLSDGDLLNLLGGEGGIQVDVVFYMVSNRTPTSVYCHFGSATNHTIDQVSVPSTYTTCAKSHQ